MSNRSDSKVWESFMNSEYAQSELKKEAQAVDRNKLYNVDPKNKTELSESVETQGVSAGGASLVGSGDSKALYNVKTAPVPGGAEQYADATVEGLEDVQKAMMEVALKEPTGKPLGTQDNNPEKWDGIQAAGSATKPIAKEGQMMMDPACPAPAMEAAPSEDETLEEILSELEKEEVPHEEDVILLASKKKNTVAFLKELVKIANELDANGQHEDASEIDAVIKDEVKTLATAKKK